MKNVFCDSAAGAGAIWVCLYFRVDGNSRRPYAASAGGTHGGDTGRADPHLVQRVIVADEAVEPGDPVVERARRGVALFGRPVKPGAAPLAGGCGDGFDQPAAAAMPAGGAVDKQILEVADLPIHPGMGVEEIVRDPDQGCGVAAEARSEAADRALRRGQPPPGVLVDLRRQLGLVEVEIAAPQLGPAFTI